jgi:hypothetical protein
MSEENDPILLDRDDVTVLPMGPHTCDECGERPVTHGVWLEMRNTGHGRRVLEACEPCATEFAQSLRASLPEQIDE